MRQMLQALLIIMLAISLAAGQPSTAQARFISPDTLDPTMPGVGTNRYSYSENDPVNKSDPNGHVAGKPDGAMAGTGLGAAIGGFLGAVFGGLLGGGAGTVAGPGGTVAGAGVGGSIGAGDGAIAGAAVGGIIGTGVDKVEDYFAGRKAKAEQSQKAEAAENEDEKEIVTLFRSVDENELSQINKLNQFTIKSGALETKQFGRNLVETERFRNTVDPASHIVSVDVDKRTLDHIADTTHVDRFMFQSGTVSIHRRDLDVFNGAIVGKVRQID